jgi:hypothetical protein
MMVPGTKRVSKLLTNNTHENQAFLPGADLMYTMNRTLPSLIVWSLAGLVAGSAPAGFAASMNTTALADAFVATGPTGNLSGNNYGGGGALAIAAGSLPNGEFQSVLRFDLSSLRNSFDAQFGAGEWFVNSVSLQLSSSPHNNAVYNEVAPGLFGVSLMQNNSWTEGTGNASNPANNGITYNTLQNTFINNAADQSLGVFGFPGGTSGTLVYTLDLNSDLNADILAGGTASLRLFAADNAVSYLFSSRAATLPSSQPQLMVVAVPEPGSLALWGVGLGMVLWRFRRLTPKRISLQSPPEGSRSRSSVR